MAEQFGHAADYWELWGSNLNEAYGTKNERNCDVPNVIRQNYKISAYFWLTGGLGEGGREG